MDYDEARAAFFGAREGDVRTLPWTTPARRLRDAIEPLATVCFWSEPAYQAYAARGLDFLGGYVWSRGSALGDADPAVVAAAFGVFEPGLVAGVVAEAREACALADVRAAKVEGVTEALRTVLGEPDADVEPTIRTLRAAIDGLPATGRPMFAGLAALDWPEDPWARLWHACTLLREHRGDAHLAALVAAGLDGLEANILTERWVGWEPLAYTGSRAWSPDEMADATARLERRGLVSDRSLTREGKELREDVESATDTAEDAVVTALGDDLDGLVERLSGWSERVVDHGWFPPDPYKRAAG